VTVNPEVFPANCIRQAHLKPVKYRILAKKLHKSFLNHTFHSAIFTFQIGLPSFRPANPGIFGLQSESSVYVQHSILHFNMSGY
jgi:hypothetical protein